MYSCHLVTGSYGLGGIRMSNNKGLTWIETGALNDRSGLDPDCLRGFGWFFGRVIANPRNENDLFLLGVELWRSIDRGEHWIQVTPDWWTYEVHADKHDIAFLKDGSFILATDGGLYKTDEFITQWEDIENIPCTQFYRVTYLPQYPNDYFGGAQDNGSMFGNKYGFNDWQKIFGGDGFKIQSRVKEPDRLFAETQNGNIWDINTYENMSDSLPGTRDWDMPYYISYHNDEKLVAGTDHIYEKIGFGANSRVEISNQLTSGGRFASRKTPTITTIDESHLDKNIIIAGTINGLVWLREKVNQYDWKDISSNLPPGYITSVKTSNTSKNILYVTMSTKQKNDYSPFVYKSVNSGQSWIPIQSNLPMFPIYDVFVYQNRHDSILFVASDIGVYVTINAGTSWQRLGDNMPYIPVFDLELNLNNNHLIAGTFARSIQSFDLKNLIKQNPLATNNLERNEEIVAFPNPCVDQLRITLNNLKSNAREGNLLDVNGKVVKHFNIEKESGFDLNMQDVSPGVYFIQIKGTKSLRIFKKEN
ncbi:MAG: T9SS type A sorting domain-containing protein [Saprospiraceae bacterium]|nr:T9SS type A sorting domain-containing protein [Candidatus Vicinibacter affinis]